MGKLSQETPPPREGEPMGVLNTQYSGVLVSITSKAMKAMKQVSPNRHLPHPPSLFCPPFLMTTENDALFQR